MATQVRQEAVAKQAGEADLTIVVGDPKSNNSNRLAQVSEEIAKTKSALDTAYSNFENVTEPDLIDCYIYELNAAQMRYRFLLRKLKEIS